ncbi:universal stress protein [Mycobacterium sp. 663a-19]|uniref:universal stress protein n=1 Tax=Mycobacterium sp. 663a-19 TaxID=2986148 RepID=UPI002D1EC704|nr:universal stress protein [Mycobacterium sp. 663a-19]MEB3982062.1 universal stress protein [Mycobacterium sp. 663a-19]
MSDIYPAPSVVVGIDGSRAAIYAALWAVDEAVARDIPLRLVYVIDPRGAGPKGNPHGAARAALYAAYRAVDATGKPVKVETEILWERPLTKLMQESRSAVLVCVGSIGLNHARRVGGTVAASLAESALCPVAVVHRPPGGPAAPEASEVVVQGDNGSVLRHAFDEARLRAVPLRVLSAHTAATREAAGNRLAQAQLSRRLARFTPLYPDVPVDSAVIRGSVAQYLRANANAGQLFVTDTHAANDVCGAYSVGCSVLTVRCGNL